MLGEDPKNKIEYKIPGNLKEITDYIANISKFLMLIHLKYSAYMEMLI